MFTVVLKHPKHNVYKTIRILQTMDSGSHFVLSLTSRIQDPFVYVALARFVER